MTFDEYKIKIKEEFASIKTVDMQKLDNLLHEKEHDVQELYEKGASVEEAAQLIFLVLMASGFKK